MDISNGHGLETIHPEDVLLVCPIEGIYLAARALLKAGDQIVVPCPAYQSLFEVGKSIGCTVQMWNFEDKADTGEIGFNIDTLRKLVTSKTKLIVANFPHNPTGALVSQDEWSELIELCRLHDCYLFSDEMYRGLEHEAGTKLPAACQLYDNAISLSGVSKTLNLPGLRIGWLVTKNPNILHALQHLKDYTTICPPAPSEILALMGLRQQEAILARNKHTIEVNLAALECFIKRNRSTFEYSKPKAGSTVFIKVLNEDAYEFSERLVKEAGIMLLPSQVFLDTEKHVNRVRVGVGRKNVPEILDRLDEYLSH
uniref:Aminotransferase class I/classII large domain-containing protein n=1 Tax=Aplanochytrium stocchinoi TaxID=215587 RepID=A0A7S3V2H7_9STRA